MMSGGGGGKKSSFDRIVEKLGPIYPQYSKYVIQWALYGVCAVPVGIIWSVCCDSGHYMERVL